MLLSRFHEYGMSTKERAGILTTIVKTAVTNGLYPDEYIIRILKNRNEVISNPEKFLPRNPWMREGIEIKKVNEVPFTERRFAKKAESTSFSTFLGGSEGGTYIFPAHNSAYNL